MQYFKENIISTIKFLKNTKSYFRDVLMLHGFMLFILIPALASTVRTILRLGSIDYLSADSIPMIVSRHPGVLLALLAVMLLILLCVFFEFTFLLISMYFILIKQPVGVKQLLQMTFVQIEKIRFSTVLFFLFYFFLLLPIGGLSFNSDLLSKIKIPAFMMDFIFSNRRIVVTAAVLLYLIFIFLSIRFIFALPEMILRDTSFFQAIKDSWAVTRRKFFAILGRFFFIGGTLLLLSSLSTFLIISLQRLIEAHFQPYAFAGAIFSMTLLQGSYLLNAVLSTVSIFFIILDFMREEGFLPALPSWFYLEKNAEKKRGTFVKTVALLLTVLLFGIGVGSYNASYLSAKPASSPVTLSHRGVSSGNGVQNTILSLKKTAQLHPDYIEMDVQETKDHQFVVYHDFDLKPLTGIDKSPSDLTLEKLQSITISENGHSAPIASFDDYLATAKHLGQKLLIEIKTNEKNADSIVTRFLEKYRSDIFSEGHTLQSLNYYVVETLKEKEPALKVGYILPFNIIGPPKSSADFLTMEYSTINRNFIDAAKEDGKKVYVWTVNNEEAMKRMMFYNVDGIITDDIKTLNRAVEQEADMITYSDQLVNFAVGIG